jgi:hypothetical protein
MKSVVCVGTPLLNKNAWHSTVVMPSHYYVEYDSGSKECVNTRHECALINTIPREYSSHMLSVIITSHSPLVPINAFNY